MGGAFRAEGNRVREKLIKPSAVWNAAMKTRSEIGADNEEHSIGSAHERNTCGASEWSAWALPIEFIELSQTSLWVLNRVLLEDTSACVD